MVGALREAGLEQSDPNHSRLTKIIVLLRLGLYNEVVTLTLVLWRNDR